MAQLSAFRAAATPAAPSGPLPSWANLKAIADAQRQSMVAFLVGLVVLPASLVAIAAHTDADVGELAPIAFSVLIVGLRAWMGVAVYRLTKAMGSRVGLLWGIGAFLPNLIGLLVLAVASARATRRLRAVGLKVGLLGASLPASPPPGFLCQELAREFA